MHLLDIVGGAGDKRGNPDLVDITLAKRRHLCEHRIAKRAGIFNGGTGGKIGVCKRQRNAQQGKSEHADADFHDLIHIVNHNTFAVDASCVKRQQQLHDRVQR